MAVLSLGEIPKLKELIQPFGFTIHVHDACGGQSFSLEAVNNETSDEVYAVIEDFFASHRMTVKFFDKAKRNFIAQ